MLNFIIPLSGNVSLQSLGLLVAGRPVGGAELLPGPARAGIHSSAPPGPAGEGSAREAPPALLSMLLSDDTRHLLGLQRAFHNPDPAGPGAGFSPPPDADAMPPSTGATPGTQAVSQARRIGNRRQALAALRQFEAQRETRLPQLGAGGRRSATLSAGVVQFQDLTDLLTTFPCALTLPGQPSGDADAVTYPRGEGPLSTPRKALLGDREVVVARELSNARRVRYSLDQRQWTPAAVYTDTVVESEKLAMWTRIFTEASRRSGAVAPEA